MAYDYSNLISAWGLVGLVMLIAIIAIFKMRENKVLGFNKWIPGIVVSALLVTSVYQVGLLSGLGFGKQTFAVGDGIVSETPVSETPVSETPAPTQLSTPATQTPAPTGGKICRIQSDGTNSLDEAVRNKENSTLAYLSGSATAISNDGSTLDTATTTAGTTLSFVTLNVPGCQDGTIYILGTAGVGVASAKTSFSSFEETTKYEMESANSNVVGVQGRSSALATASNGQVNGSSEVAYIVSGAGASDGTAYFTNTTLASGGSINGYLDWTVNGTASVNGAYNQADGVVFSYDSGTASVFSKESLSFSDMTGIGLKSLPCPATITANRNAETCWSARTLKATDGEIRTKFKLSADLADPVASTTAPRLCVDDKVYFRDTNGKIAYDFFSSSGTNQGTGGTCIVFPTN